MSSDLPFGRLMQAWNRHEGSGFRESEPVAYRSGGLADPVEAHSVLWLGPCAMGGSWATPPLTLASSAPGGSGFHIRWAAPSGADEQAAVLSRLQPRLLVADVEWCSSVGSSHLRRLHRHAPQVDWLLCWDQPSPRWIDALIQSGARGAVTRQASPSELTRAFDAVMTGEIWLPRLVMQWLYAFLLEAPQRAVSSLHDAAQRQLTSREAEAVALLRRGLTNQAIAERLGVSINTVKKHLVSAYDKCGIRSRRQTLG
jgi:DNA-binding NarL/FixJ family response regulator